MIDTLIKTMIGWLSSLVNAGQKNSAPCLKDEVTKHKQSIKEDIIIGYFSSVISGQVYRQQKQ